MKKRPWLMALAAVIPLLANPPGFVRADKARTKELLSLGTLRAPSVDAARSQTFDWLRNDRKADGAILKKAEAIWAQEEQSVLDRVAATLALVDGQAAKLLAQASDASIAAPTAVPALLKDASSPVFFRANLALAYAKALASHRVFEESLEVLRLVRPDQVIDPAAYFFYRAVAEHAMTLKNDALRSIIGLTEDVAETPERYKTVAALMYHDIMAWKSKDLGEIARKMDNIERRLELARGGPKTQKIQREVVLRLDELIKQLDNKGGS